MMYKEKAHYSVIIAGATLTAIGIAIAALKTGKDVLIVEKTSLIGSEFIDSLSCNVSGSYITVTGECKELEEEMYRRNLISGDRRLHLPPVAPLLFGIVKERGIEILFMTDIIKVISNDNGYEIDLFNASGFRMVQTEIIIDTTASFVTNMQQNQDVIYKSLNSLVTLEDACVYKDSMIDSCSCCNLYHINNTMKGKKIVFCQGRFDNIIIMKYQLDISTGWIEARRILIDFIKNRPEHLRKMRIICIANTFELHTSLIFYKIEENKAGINSKTMDSCWYRMPSCAFKDLLEAYDFGIQTDFSEVLPVVAARRYNI